MENQISVQFNASELETLLANLDGLIYSLGFDQDENLIKLHENLSELYNEFQNNHRLQ